MITGLFPMAKIHRDVTVGMRGRFAMDEYVPPVQIGLLHDSKAMILLELPGSHPGGGTRQGHTD
jgi:hypothetical protein